MGPSAVSENVRRGFWIDFFSPPKWNNFLPGIFAPRWLRVPGCPGSNHYPGYDSEKCPHPLPSSLSSLFLAVIGPTERADHCISWDSRRNIEFQCLILPPKDRVWWSQAWNYLLLSPVNTEMSARHKTDPRPLSRRIAALSRPERMKLKPRNLLSLNSFTMAWSVEWTKYSGGGGISIKFSKMVFLYKCGSNFSVYAQRFKFRASTKVILPRAGQDLDPSQPGLGFLQFLSRNLEERLSLSNICVIWGSYQRGRVACDHQWSESGIIMKYYPLISLWSMPRTDLPAFTQF